MFNFKADFNEVKMTKEKLNPVGDTQEIEADLKELILFNDDENSFDFVIDSLIDILGHDSNQAEQCAMIAHYNGKCPVKSGTFTELKPSWQQLTERKLIVQIN